MSLGVLNNIAATLAQTNLNQTQNSLQNTLTQLSSGSRINSGADDAAGLALADGLHANVAALTQSSQNATAGVGLLQTADGALSQVTNLLNRAVTLATEAANGTLNSSQVSSANQEYQNILSEIGNIGSTTNFNGNSVFSATAKSVFVSDGTSSGATTFSETTGALSTASVGTSAPAAASSVAITNPTPTAPTAGAGATATFALGAATNTISGTLSVSVGGAAAVSATLAAGTTLATAVTQLNANAGFSGAGLVASQGTGANANKLIITGPTGVTNTLSLTGTALSDTTPAGTSAGPGVDFTAAGVATLSAATATAVLTSVTNAIQDVAYQRGSIGANINELNAASNVASSESVNLTSAENSVRATNYGQATSDLAKYKVLSETGISALSQANSVQQEVLKLLQ
ncbi:flagellin N-terminal helical domain-containing protein [Edaphobacter bradus]|uniref:flagellin N-terminal helical domain-containing protein n=1 Tax=Edaphobacter bradus TaxID=2259016 RepID=UPI0021E0B19A|nr:flagellin [Edaphobacter bradus]